MKLEFTKFCSVVLLGILLFVASDGYSQVLGTVYQDFNGNGIKDNTSTFNEVGLSGVTVLATNSAGQPLGVNYTGGGASTNATGGYSISGGTLGQIRLEFQLPDNHTFASRGTNGGTTVMFPTTAIQDLAVNYPGFYSQSNPRVASQHYSNGDNQVAGSGSSTPRSLVSFPQANGTINTLSNMGSVGATWGLAYHKQSGKLFSAAFAKRHVNTGPLGLSGIYVTPNAQSANSLSATTSFVNLSSVNPSFNAGSTTRDFSPGYGNPNNSSSDADVFNKVGKIGMGDLDVSDDGQYLYTVNLNDRRVWRIEVGKDGVAPVNASQIQQYSALPDNCVSSTFRPFAIKYFKGDIYVGGICDGVANEASNSSVNRNNLTATVYKVSATATPATASFVQVFSFPLTFNRYARMTEGVWEANTPYRDPNGYNNSISHTSWHPWTRSTADFELGRSSAASNTFHVAYPQPMLMDLEFDVEGSMILGFGDRMGHQGGKFNYAPGSTTSSFVTTAGDILRASPGFGGAFVLENNGTSGGVTTQGAGDLEGPGGGEFYWEDNFQIAGSGVVGPLGVMTRASIASPFHAETGTGGLALMAGSGTVMEAVYDPRQQSAGSPEWGGFQSGGVRWYSNTTGKATDAIAFFTASTVGGLGKASGVGDVELLNDSAPIEIGNRVWLDSNNNGIQDAGESGIGGISVTLYASNCSTFLGSATTDANGNYFFSSAIGGSTSSTIYGVNLQPNTSYCLVFPLVSGANSISIKPNEGGNDLLDSDAESNGRITFTTGSAGQNNHSFDVGYYSCPFVPAPTSVTATPSSYCTGGSSTLSANCTTGTAVWYTDLGATSLLTGGTLVSPTNTTPYYVRCESGTCHSTVGSVTVTVNPQPTIIAGTPQCNAAGTHYSVVFTIPSGATITSPVGTVSGNTVSNIPSGTPATVTVSQNGCTASITVSQTCTIACVPPTATVAVTQPTCTASGRISITGFSTGERFSVSEGSTFTAGSAISTIPTGGIVVSSLPNQTRTVTVRIYTSNDDTCYKEQTVSVNAVSPCCPTGDCATATIQKNDRP